MGDADIRHDVCDERSLCGSIQIAIRSMETSIAVYPGRLINYSHMQ